MITFDTYNLRARIVPATLAVLPVLLLLTLAVPKDSLGLPQALAGALGAVLLAIAADLGRRFGKRAEKSFFHSTGGQPFATALRHRDSTFDPVTTLKYHRWLSERLKEASPTPDNEAQDPTAADQFYSRCSTHLRTRTYDKDRFRILAEENVTYGYRRNLFGLKRAALLLDLVVALAIAWYLTSAPTIPFIDLTEGAGYFVLAVTALHGLYFVLAVTRTSVIEASNQYSRQLVLACEVLSEEA